MPNVSISAAAKLAGKSRETLRQHIKSGKISTCQDTAGNPTIDTAELMRVYGPIRQVSGQELEVNNSPGRQTVISDIEVLREQLKLAQEREAWLKQQVEAEQERSRELERRMLPPGQEKIFDWSWIVISILGGVVLAMVAFLVVKGG